MTMPVLVTLAEVAPQPWRNGGGRTRELLRWPAQGQRVAPDDDAWSLRVSVADIEAAGPFSAFPGTERWFAVIDGAGVRLRWTGREKVLRAGSSPLRFDGGDPPDCTPIDGPTRDLNLICRGGPGQMQPVQAGSAWAARGAVRALFTACAGRFTDGRVDVRLPADSLLWSDSGEHAAWRFAPEVLRSDARAWWLAFDLTDEAAR